MQHEDRDDLREKERRHHNYSRSVDFQAERNIIYKNQLPDDDIDDRETVQQRASICDFQLFMLMTIVILENTMYAIVAPFLPLEYDRRGVSHEWIGAIFATFSIASIIASPMIGSMISCCGRRFLLVLGILMMAFASFTFAVSYTIKQPAVFIAVQILCRFVQGFGDGLVLTTVYSIVANFYPNDQEAMIGYIESAMGIGLCLGPIAGSSLYAIGGHNLVFYTFTALLMIFAPIVNFMLKSELDGPAITQNAAFRQQYEDEDAEPLMGSSTRSSNGKRPVGYCDLLSNVRCLFAAFAGLLQYFMYGFFEPILAFRIEQFELKGVQAGLIFSILPVFYMIFTLMPQRIPNGIEKRAIIMFACFAIAGFNLCVGPSQFLHMPNRLTIMCFGLIMHGVCEPFVIVPSLPEMINSMSDKHPGQETEVNDLCAGLFNMFLGLGQVIGPLYGSALTKRMGFRHCCDTVSAIALVYATLYFIMCDGFGAFRNSRWEHIEPEEGQVEQKVLIKKTGSLSIGQVIRQRSSLTINHKADDDDTIKI